MLHNPCDELAYNFQSVKSSNKKTNLFLWFLETKRGMMKFVAVVVFVAFILADGVDSASVSLSSSQLTLNGNAQIQFYGGREAVWAGLSNGKHFND